MSTRELRRARHLARLQPTWSAAWDGRCSRSFATVAASRSTTPSPAIDQTLHASLPIQRYPPTQPPSHRRPEFRKSQLHRQYASLIRSSPVILLFQHNCLTSVEWAAVRRELGKALRAVDAELTSSGQDNGNIADSIKIQIIRGSIFDAALKVVEFFEPSPLPTSEIFSGSDPTVHSSATFGNATHAGAPSDHTLTHGLSRQAFHSARADRSRSHGLEPLLAGPIAILTFPAASTAHLRRALSILSPNKEFPAPKRRTDPNYHELDVQLGVQKLMLLGARVEDKAFDIDRVGQLAKIEGGLQGLRAQLVYLLGAAGASLTSTLEGAAKSLYVTVESRKLTMEDAERDKGDGGNQ